MPAYCLGSFPNSRVAPRPATQRAETQTLEITAIVNTPVAVANPNRTYLTIKNNGPYALNYGYTDASDLATNGFTLQPGEGIDIDSPGEVWAISLDVTNPTFMSIDEGSG